MICSFLLLKSDKTKSFYNNPQKVKEILHLVMWSFSGWHDIALHWTLIRFYHLVPIYVTLKKSPYPHLKKFKEKCVHAIVSLRLVYCHRHCWTALISPKCLQLIQNAAARGRTGTNESYHISLVLKSFHSHSKLLLTSPHLALKMDSRLLVIPYRYQSAFSNWAFSSCAIIFLFRAKQSHLERLYTDLFWASVNIM